VAAEEEADELLAVAAGNGNVEMLVERRSSGEPLAWITGSTTFCGLRLSVDQGVYVPRWQSEALARCAATLLKPGGTAVDLCTGSGAIAAVLSTAIPTATVLGTELDPIAARCARQNGVDVVEGDLDEPIPSALRGQVDVLVGVLPYVPASKMGDLPRDVVAFEPALALNGGDDGLSLVRRAVYQSTKWLRPQGHLLLEVGIDQIDALAVLMTSRGLQSIDIILDGDGEERGVLGRFDG
jgi:release factor glutamine methyltransferase